MTTITRCRVGVSLCNFLCVQGSGRSGLQRDGRLESQGGLGRWGIAGARPVVLLLTPGLFVALARFRATWRLHGFSFLPGSTPV